MQFEGESASGSDRDARDDSDDRSSRAKRLRRVNVDDSLSAFAPKTKTKLGHIPASEFAKSQWNSIRGMDPVSGKFLVKDRPKHDDWMKMHREASFYSPLRCGMYRDSACGISVDSSF